MNRTIRPPSRAETYRIKSPVRAARLAADFLLWIQELSDRRGIMAAIDYGCHNCRTFDNCSEWGATKQQRDTQERRMIELIRNDPRLVRAILGDAAGYAYQEWKDAAAGIGSPLVHEPQLF